MLAFARHVGIGRWYDEVEGCPDRAHVDPVEWFEPVDEAVGPGRKLVDARADRADCPAEGGGEPASASRRCEQDEAAEFVGDSLLERTPSDDAAHAVGDEVDARNASVGI